MVSSWLATYLLILPVLVSSLPFPFRVLHEQKRSIVLPIERRSVVEGRDDDALAGTVGIGDVADL